MHIIMSKHIILPYLSSYTSYHHGFLGIGTKIRTTEWSGYVNNINNMMPHVVLYALFYLSRTNIHMLINL